MLRWWRLGVSVALVACAASSTEESEDDDGGQGGAGGDLFQTGGSSAGGNLGCSEEAELIYVLSDANELYSFRPDQKEFSYIGVLGCQTSMLPNSMAIDRDAVAWVNYVEGDSISDTAGAIFRVSTSDASCEASPAVVLPAGWYRIGMGYATDGTTGEGETLYVTGTDGNGRLGRVEGGAVVPIGTFGGAFANQNAELTGTGDARLFAFFTTSPVEVAELEEANAAIIQSTPLPAVEIPNAWAFSFWGGDFYLYTATTGDSRVNHFRSSDGTVDTSYMTDIGFRIVGAGVSTCAPVAPPQ